MNIFFFFNRNVAGLGGLGDCNVSRRPLPGCEPLQPSVRLEPTSAKAKKQCNMANRGDDLWLAPWPQRGWRLV